MLCKIWGFHGDDYEECRLLGYKNPVRTSQETYASTVCYGSSFTFLYVDDIRTSQETYASTVCYGSSFTFLYADDVRTSQETYASTVCYGSSVTFLSVDDVHTSLSLLGSMQPLWSWFQRDTEPRIIVVVRPAEMHPTPRTLLILSLTVEAECISETSGTLFTSTWWNDPLNYHERVYNQRASSVT
jgi:hypothetical protein